MVAATAADGAGTARDATAVCCATITLALPGGELFWLAETGAGRVAAAECGVGAAEAERGWAALAPGVALRDGLDGETRALPARPGEADADEELSGPDGSVPSANAGASVNP